MRYIEVLFNVLGRPAQMRMLPMQPGDLKATFADTTDFEREYGWQSTTPIEVGLRKFVACTTSLTPPERPSVVAVKAGTFVALAEAGPE